MQAKLGSWMASEVVGCTSDALSGGISVMHSAFSLPPAASARQVFLPGKTESRKAVTAK